MRQVSGKQVSMTLPDYRGHRCQVDGRHVHLTAMEAELVAALLVTSPDRIGEMETLIEIVWPDPDTQALTAPNVLSVIVMRLRKKGLPIKTIWGRGYAIVEEARGGRSRVRDYIGGESYRFAA